MILTAVLLLLLVCFASSWHAERRECRRWQREARNWKDLYYEALTHVGDTDEDLEDLLPRRTL